MTTILPYKASFIDLMLECQVLTFGDFITKSGRKTPYFINSGNFKDGRAATLLGEFYADTIVNELGDEIDNLYGPAYKGIPLAAVTSSALYRKYDRNISYTFNRKELKDHGEGGNLVGYSYEGSERVVIIEDVVTAGTSVRESIPILEAAGIRKISGLVVSVDRQEKGSGDKSALDEIRDLGINAFAIVTLDEIVSYLSDSDVLDRDICDRIDTYRQEFGA